MHIGKGRVRAAWEPAMSIPSQYLSALGPGRETPGPAFVHGVSDVVVDRDGNGGVTGDPAHRFGVDEADVMELAGECSTLARPIDQGVEWDVGDNEERVGWGVAGVAPRRGTND